MAWFNSRTKPKDTPSSGGDCIAFGDEWIPNSEATLHFLLAAATGGGKTTLIRKWLQSILAHLEVLPN